MSVRAEDADDVLRYFDYFDHPSAHDPAADIVAGPSGSHTAPSPLTTLEGPSTPESTMSTSYNSSLPSSPSSLGETTAGGNSYDTNLTSPSTSWANKDASASEESPSLPNVDIDRPPRVNGWTPANPDTSLANENAVGSFVRPMTPLPAFSGVSRALYRQADDTHVLTSPTSPSLSQATSRSSSVILGPRPRPALLRPLILTRSDLKLKLSRSRSILSPSSSSGSSRRGSPSTARPVTTDDVRVIRPGISPLVPPSDPSRDKGKGKAHVRSYTLPLSTSLLNEADHIACLDATLYIPEFQAKPKPEPRDAFELLPIELRLYIFASLVRLFVDELARRVEGRHGGWSVNQAAKTRWVGWEAGVRELVKISRVSRTWQTLALDGQLWALLGAQSASSTFLPLSVLERISLSAGPFVRILDLYGTPSLSSKTLSVLTRNLSASGATPQKFDANRSTLPIDSWPNNLTSLNLQGCTTLSSKELHQILASSPKLEELCLKGLNAVNNTTCLVIGNANPGLVKLDLGRCAAMDAYGVLYLCEASERRRMFSEARRSTSGGGIKRPESVSGMKQLKLGGLRRVFDDLFGAIARAFPKLEVLDVGYSVGLTDSCLERLVRVDVEEEEFASPPPKGRDAKSTNGEVVYLTAREIGLDPTDRTLYPRRVTALRHLILSHSTSLTDGACSALAYTVPNLEILELAGIGPHEFEDAGLLRLLKTTPKIRKLDLEDAARITDEVLNVLTPVVVRERGRPNRTMTAPIPIPSVLSATTGISRPAPPSRATTLPFSSAAPSPPPQPGEMLEHLVISYASLITPGAMSDLIKACPRLHTLEADNTRISDEVMREFVTVMRSRRLRHPILRSTSPSSPSPSSPPSATQSMAPLVAPPDAGTLVVIDCAHLERDTIDSLARRGYTRPRAGTRSYSTRILHYADRADKEDSALISLSLSSHPNSASAGEVGVMDECDEDRVVLKTFRSWQAVDRWQGARKKVVGLRERELERERRESSRPASPGAWWRRGTRSQPGTPFEGEEDDRGCVVM